MDKSYKEFERSLFDRNKKNEEWKSKYFVSDAFSEEPVQIAGYILNEYERGQISLVKENDKYFCKTEEWWPAHRGASNGGLITTEIDYDFFKRTGICDVDGFLLYFCKKNFAPCIKLMKEHKDKIAFISSIIEQYL